MACSIYYWNHVWPLHNTNQLSSESQLIINSFELRHQNRNIWNISRSLCNVTDKKDIKSWYCFLLAEWHEAACYHGILLLVVQHPALLHGRQDFKRATWLQTNQAFEFNKQNLYFWVRHTFIVYQFHPWLLCCTWMSLTLAYNSKFY